MSLRSVVRAEGQWLLPTYERHPVLFERGTGCYLYDEGGRRYLDFLSGIGVNAFGYSHPAILRTLRRQASRLIHVSNLYYHDYQAALARRLTALAGLERAFFTNSGTEAIEGALKLARAYARLSSSNGRNNRAHRSGPRWRILALENSFHGRTFAALAATGTAKYRAPFGPLVPGVRFVRFNDVNDLEKKFDSTVCAVLLEPVQGEGGIRALSREFFARAHRLTRTHNALLIADEIQCGLGRTGRYFAFQQYGVEPDVVTVAKPLAAGLPLGAILTRERIARGFRPGLHGTTFGGGPLACAVALTFLDLLTPARLAHIGRLGRYFRQRLEELQGRYAWIREVRGRGLMLAVELAFPGKEIVRHALERGIILNCTHETVLRFLPPYIIESRHVDEFVSTLDSVLADVNIKHRRPGARTPASRPARRSCG